MTITGLAAGTMEEPAVYYLKETKAPDKYTLNAHVFKIEIAAEYYESQITDEDKDAGELKNWIIAIDRPGSIALKDYTSRNTFEVENNGTVTINDEKGINETGIQNTKTSTLPSTGGTGTYLFTIVGVMIMAAVAGMFLVSRRKDEDKR